jgi:hypothetical protein
MEIKLTPRQHKLVKKGKWVVKPSGVVVRLYSEDYSPMGWAEMCEVAQVEPYVQVIDFLAFGIKVID